MEPAEDLLAGGDLTDFQKMTVRIAKKTSDFSTPINWRGYKLSTSRFKNLIGFPTIWYSDSELVANGMSVHWRCEGYVRLILGRSASGN
jgi:hypothetical protein